MKTALLKTRKVDLSKENCFNNPMMEDTAESITIALTH